MVLSGHGLHLYYIFYEPIELRPKVLEGLQRVKDSLTEIIWNDFTSNIRPTTDKPYVKQYQSFVQGYRIIGFASKIGKDYPVRAWRIGLRWSIKAIECYFKKDP